MVVFFARELLGIGVTSNGLKLWGNVKIPAAVDPSYFPVAFGIWCHYNDKYVELLDTLFMILRKKKNQVTFLHVWHHELMCAAWLVVCKVKSTWRGSCTC